MLPAELSFEQASAFVRDNTALLSPPLVPELVLHLACESMMLWQKTEDELEAINLPPPYWAFAWAGGQALARYVLDRPDLVAGRAVLDLGAGSGITSIAAVRAGAASALAADPDRFATAAVTLNALANRVHVETTMDDLLDADAGSFDVVLIGDLFYERPLAERVAAFARRAIAGGSLVLVGDPKRSYLPIDALEWLAEYSVPVTRDLEDTEIKRTSVWRFAR